MVNQEKKASTAVPDPTGTANPRSSLAPGEQRSQGGCTVPSSS